MSTKGGRPRYSEGEGRGKKRRIRPFATKPGKRGHFTPMISGRIGNHSQLRRKREVRRRGYLIRSLRRNEL